MADATDSLESRVGQAMHRLLEWVPLQEGPQRSESRWSAAQRAQVARAFGLGPDDVARAERMAQGILAGEAAWAWQRPSVVWHANEVALAHAGRTLRLDRLVQHRATQAWWVLDFKSTATPQDQPDLCDQLREYRTALQLIQPGSQVHIAFLTPQGRLIELFD